MTIFILICVEVVSFSFYLFLAEVDRMDAFEVDVLIA